MQVIDQEKAEQKRIYMREYARQRRANDPAFLEKCREQNRKSREKHINRALQGAAEWKASNKEKVSEYNKIYSKQNSEQIKLVRSKRDKIKRKSDPVFVIKARLRNRVWSMLKNKKKSATTEKMLGCSYEFFKTYIEQKFSKNMGWHNMGEWHIDHIKPLASFDLNDFEQQAIAFHYTNHQPLWAKDNIAKGAKIIEVIYG
jgi:hypothetical protein